MGKLEEKIRDLPPDLQQEVEDFVEFLAERRKRKKAGRMSLDWRGALRDMRDKFTSVELQHSILRDWPE